MLTTLLGMSSEIYLIEAKSPRSKKINILIQETAALKADAFRVINNGDIKSTIQHVLKKQNLDKKGVAICGSFFNMFETRQELGFEDEQDAIFLNEFSLETKK